MDTNYFRLNSALNGGSVWQNNCKKILHTGSRFDNNTSERGSAGIEMNQITSADIVSCTFTTGKSAKGSGLYLQVCMPSIIKQHDTHGTGHCGARFFILTIVCHAGFRRGCKGQCASACLSQMLLTSEVQSSEAQPPGTSADLFSTPTRPPRLEAQYMTHMPRCSFFHTEC